MVSEYDVWTTEFLQALFIVGHGGLAVGGGDVVAGQADQMLTEQGIQGQDWTKKSGAEEIPAADAFRVGIGIDANGALVLAEESLGIVAVEEAEPAAEIYNGNVVYIAQELAVIAAEEVCFDNEVK